MTLYEIADIIVSIEHSHPTMLRQVADYICPEVDVKPQMFIKADNTAYEYVHNMYPELTDDECEYLITGFRFNEGLIAYDGLMLHSSAVVYEGNAYLFSADSGVGKSTHTRLWQERFGEDVIILNDDKPAIRIIDNIAYAYGTPWGGKNGINTNIKAPIKGICFMHRSETNHISKASASDILVELLKQTIRPVNSYLASKMLDNIDKLISAVDFYNMGCNMDLDAAETAYYGMKG